MLVKQMIYFLCLLIFLVGIFNLIYSIKNKNSKVSEYIIILSITFILYSIVVLIMPEVLHLDVGLEFLLFSYIVVLTSNLFIISIIVASKKAKKLNTIGKSIKYKIIFTILIIFPIFMFCFSYFREINYINNSKLILVCSEGDGFNEEDYAYAISDDYSKMITIGTDFGGYAMEKHLPSSFYEFNYNGITDKIEISNNKIIIYRNDKIIYKMNLSSKIPYCDVEKVFYKK